MAFPYVKLSDDWDGGVLADILGGTYWALGGNDVESTFGLPANVIAFIDKQIELGRLVQATQSEYNAAKAPGFVPFEYKKAHYLATEADVLAGIDDTLAVTPAGLSARLEAGVTVESETIYLDVRSDFGAGGFGVTDDTAAIQAAIDEACGDGNPASVARYASAAVLIPDGTYRITAPLTVRSVIGLQIIGKGNAVIHADADMASVLDINGAGFSQFGGFTITGSAGTQVDDAIYSYWELATSIFPNTMNKYHDITIRNIDYVTGFRVGKPSTGGIATDNDSFNNIIINGDWSPGNTTRYQCGMHLGNGTGGNNLVHHIYKYTAGSNRRHLWVDFTEVALYGAGFDTSEIDIFVAATGYCYFSGIRSESAERFLLTTSGDIPINIVVDSVSWAADSIVGTGQWITFSQTGTISLRGVKCYYPSGAALAITPVVIIGNGVGPARGYVEGFYVNPPLSGTPVDASQAFIPQAKSTVEVRGYMAVNTDGSLNRIQDWVGPQGNYQSGTSYTFEMRDYIIPMNSFNNAAAITVTIPNISTVRWPVGIKIPIMQQGAGRVTVVAPGLTGTPGTKTRTQGSVIYAHHWAADNWVITGDSAV